MTPFELHSRLEADSFPVTDLDLCVVRLIKDATYPWVLVVPAINGLVEIVDLDAPDRGRLMEEIAAVSDALREATGCHKLNVAALGNQVPQLHVHVIARFADDAAWPGPVWGAAPASEYEGPAKERLIHALAERLKV